MFRVSKVKKQLPTYASYHQLLNRYQIMLFSHKHYYLQEYSKKLLSDPLGLQYQLFPLPIIIIDLGSIRSIIEITIIIQTISISLSTYSIINKFNNISTLKIN
ncbi:hypothetical protein ACTA71_011341 [Dictyostelium dimigraforme]